MLQSRVKFKFKDSNRWTNEERPSVEELISIKNHESLTKGDQGFMYNLLCSFRIYNFHNNLITFRNEVFSLLLAWEIAWAVISKKACTKSFGQDRTICHRAEKFLLELETRKRLLNWIGERVEEELTLLHTEYFESNTSSKTLAANNRFQCSWNVIGRELSWLHLEFYARICLWSRKLGKM